MKIYTYLISLLFFSITLKASFEVQETNSFNFETESNSNILNLGLTLKNIGTGIDSVPDLIDSNFKMTLNRCKNIRVNKFCKIIISSKTKKLNANTYTLNFSNIIDLNQSQLVITYLINQSAPPTPVSLVNFIPNQLDPIEFEVNQSKRLINFSIKNDGNTIINPSISQENSNSKIILNRCSGISLKPNKKCEIILQVKKPNAECGAVDLVQTVKIFNNLTEMNSLLFHIIGTTNGSVIVPDILSINMSSNNTQLNVTGTGFNCVNSATLTYLVNGSSTVSNLVISDKTATSLVLTWQSNLVVDPGNSTLTFY